MRLVGASGFLIATPFMLEAVIAVLIGAALAVVALWVFVKVFVVDFLSVELVGFNYIDTSEIWVAAPVLIVVGVLLAAIASLVSLGRYLKV